MSKYFVFFFTAILSACTSTPKGTDGLGYEGYNRGGKTVEETLASLRNNPSINVRVDGGWTIATLESGSVIWSFTPPEHPAHPSYVKREVIDKDGRIYINTRASCGAEKNICDELVQDFIELNNKISKGMQGE